jgi:pyruvate/2-oxoglutarate dehydrogenase complex dihydrolipoamide acyltransferase (E2) component
MHNTPVISKQMELKLQWKKIAAEVGCRPDLLDKWKKGRSQSADVGKKMRKWLVDKSSADEVRILLASIALEGEAEQVKQAQQVQQTETPQQFEQQVLQDSKLDSPSIQISRGEINGAAQKPQQQQQQQPQQTPPPSPAPASATPPAPPPPPQPLQQPKKRKRSRTAGRIAELKGHSKGKLRFATAYNRVMSIKAGINIGATTASGRTQDRFRCPLMEEDEQVAMGSIFFGAHLQALEKKNWVARDPPPFRH